MSIGIAACSESGVSLDKFPGAYARALCTQNFKCCSGTDIGANTMQDCVDTNESSLQFLAGSISDAQSRGRVRYDKDKMKDCIDAVSKLTCDDWSTGFTMSSQPAICDQAVVAMVGMDGACRDDIECVTGNCQGEDPANDVDGACKAADSSGLSCVSSDDCAPDFYCDAATSACAAKKVTGATCSLNEECRTRCNGTTGQCSCYAGCAMAGPVSPGLLCLLAVACLILLAGRARNGGRCALSRPAK
ncbi:MAG TPA: hypothetical protein VIF57_08750 [Polyangia bacterium]